MVPRPGMANTLFTHASTWSSSPAPRLRAGMHLALAVGCLWAMVGLARAEDGGKSAELPGNRYVQARLALERTAMAPDGSTQLAVIFDIAPGWHLYWRNAGDGGLPPRVKFTAPAGVTIGAPQWPAPQREVTGGGLINYVYAGRLVLLFPITIDAASAGAGPLAISADVDWLVCRERCIPGRAELAASWPVSAESAPSAEAEVFAEARQRLPEALPAEGGGVAMKWEGAELVLHVDGAARLAFFPYENEPGVYPDNILSGGEARADTLRLSYSAQAGRLAEIAGVVAVTRDGGERFYEVRIPAPTHRD